MGRHARRLLLLAASVPHALAVAPRPPSAQQEAGGPHEYPYWGAGLSEEIPPLSLAEAAETGEPLFRMIWGADPSARVINGEMWFYVSHDAHVERGAEGTPDVEGRPEQFAITEFHMFSASSASTGVVPRGVALKLEQVPWATQMLWAPDVVQAPDGSIRLFFPGKDQEGNFRIGVARSAQPEGPFVADAAPIQGSFSIDPHAYNAPNGSTLLYFGGLWAGQLERFRTPAEDGLALGVQAGYLSDSQTEFVSGPQEVVILDEEGKPLTANDTDRRFFEASWLIEREGTHYLLYSTGDTHKLVYATSPSPLGPFTYRGVLLSPVVGWTTHCSVVQFDGEWWMLHQDSTLSAGDTSKRIVKVAKVTFGEGETMSVRRESASSASSVSLAKIMLKTRTGARRLGKLGGASDQEVRTLLEGAAAAH